MNVLSLFDGISCGQVALNRVGIEYDNYFASEIDKFAIAVTQYRYPDTIQLGDVKNWENWDLPDIDLLIGGFPCQPHSLAGKQKGFKDSRGQVFFDLVDILKYYKPKYFLFENVKMKQESQDTISDLLGVKPIEINSALVSAQNRKRLYWTNIPGIEQPEDCQTYLKDIIEYGTVDRYKSFCIDANYFKGGNLKQYFKNSRRQLVFEKPHGYNKGGFREKDKFNTLRECTAHNYAILDDRPNKLCYQVGIADINGIESIKRVYSVEGKSPTLTTMGGGHREPKIAIDLTKWRKLTPLECERLQTLPDNYTLVPYGKRMMSNTQRYKQTGNGWTVDVIAHIFKNIFG